LPPEAKKSNDIERETFDRRRMTSKAWPYEEARKLLKRWPDGKPRRADDLRDRLRPVGPAAYRHLQRGAAHDFVRHAYEELTAARRRG
jgi:lysyl-tRNA synthetase class 1